MWKSLLPTLALMFTKKQLGVTSVTRHVIQKNKAANPWLLKLLEHRSCKLGRYRSGQQDGLHPVGHDYERHALPAHAVNYLIIGHRRGRKRAGARDGNRSN